VTALGSARRTALALVATLAILGGPASAGRVDGDAPPAALVSGAPARGAAIDPVFALLKLERLSCKFSEEKQVALLARPLTSTGTIHFERERGIARSTLTPKVQHVVLTRTTLRIRTDKKSEEIPLDKSKDLRAFALIFPTLLRGERAELERAFDLGLYGSAGDWWALSFTPKTASLKKLVKRVVVFGRKTQVVSLQILEASGDTTVTRLTDIRTNAEVPDTEIATAFGAR
jgi:outer membrane lipoprotein-sorting protein